MATTKRRPGDGEAERVAPARHYAASAFGGFLTRLLQASDPAAVPRLVMDGPVSFLQPLTVSVWIARDGGLFCVAALGYRGDEGVTGRSVPLDERAPITEAFLQHRVVEVLAADVPEQYDVPAERSEIWSAITGRTGFCQIVSAPIVSGGTCTGALGILSGRPVTWGPDEADLLSGTTSALGLWLGSLGGELDAGSLGTASAPPPRPRLTARQRAILALLAEGATTTRMSSALRCSTSTVEKDVHAIVAALGASDRVSAVAVARGVGLLHDRRRG
jgi:DNA-binding CsgD family transcriptional regulator